MQSSTIKFNYQSEINKYPNKIVYLLGQQTAFKLPHRLFLSKSQAGFSNNFKNQRRTQHNENNNKSKYQSLSSPKLN